LSAIALDFAAFLLHQNRKPVFKGAPEGCTCSVTIRRESLCAVSPNLRFVFAALISFSTINLRCRAFVV
jgi:hypothetical protein